MSETEKMDTFSSSAMIQMQNTEAKASDDYPIRYDDWTIRPSFQSTTYATILELLDLDIAYESNSSAKLDPITALENKLLGEEEKAALDAKLRDLVRENYELRHIPPKQHTDELDTLHSTIQSMTEEMESLQVKKDSEIEEMKAALHDAEREKVQSTLLPLLNLEETYVHFRPVNLNFREVAVLVEGLMSIHGDHLLRLLTLQELNEFDMQATQQQSTQDAIIALFQKLSASYASGLALSNECLAVQERTTRAYEVLLEEYDPYTRDLKILRRDRIIVDLTCESTMKTPTRVESVTIEKLSEAYDALHKFLEHDEERQSIMEMFHNILDGEINRLAESLVGLRKILKLLEIPLKEVKKEEKLTEIRTTLRTIFNEYEHLRSGRQIESLKGQLQSAKDKLSMAEKTLAENEKARWAEKFSAANAVNGQLQKQLREKDSMIISEKAKIEKGYKKMAKAKQDAIKEAQVWRSSEVAEKSRTDIAVEVVVRDAIASKDEEIRAAANAKAMADKAMEKMSRKNFEYYNENESLKEQLAAMKLEATGRALMERQRAKDAGNSDGKFELEKLADDYTGLIEGRIKNGKLYVLSAEWKPSRMMLYERQAVLHQLYRAIITSPTPLPDTILTLSIIDNPRQNAWSFARSNDPRIKGNYWVMPHFAYWSWPKPFIGTMDTALSKIQEVERQTPWDNKIDKAVWRGTAWFNSVGNTALRPNLLKETKGKDWADVEDMKWKMNGVEAANSIEIDEFCRYKYIIYTEGVTYSGRLPFHQACGSIILTPPLTYQMHTTHFMKPLFSYTLPFSPSYNSKTTPNSNPRWPKTYPASEANVVFVEPDWSDLEQTIDYLRKHDEIARGIAERQRGLYIGGGYGSEAAEVCYWRGLVRGWAGVVKPKHGEWNETGIRWETFSLIGETSWERAQ
ncbi:hypothetical protein G7Y89_g7760 [Cudoniella acicularis]|uniref:Glycosyl transferase CAP10 domain-containing protein n=1 Tax=Cudoniella acicularis TaxID=354080 RepID=A0A8H4RJW1_9HELO|nr:hypothetical protein G7Y89_g7760 [Cudoniella acicularis]